MVDLGCFAHLVPLLLDNYELTPKLLNLQKDPPESASKLPIVHLRPCQMQLSSHIDRLVRLRSSTSSDLAEELVNVAGSGRRTHRRRQIWQENSSASSDLAEKLISIVGFGRRTHSRRQIWPENSSASSDLAGELISIVGSGRRTRQRRRIWPENS
ncbi:hypothetical protein DY000_02049447 [Brassica cretica]|uniref:Uncharacterized protein n=1 Tax=Brassica cretica TaxID=69181 RepID=A0ABQ7ETK3_BRACR|nr:hypothetical protein DY000_02049447 [Brassica cretica]